MEPGWIDWGAVVLLAAIVGFAELVGRYKDEPVSAVATWPAVGYMLVNVVASAAALALISMFGITFGFNPQDPQVSTELRVTRVLVAGFAAMAFFRSSFFVTRVGNQDVAVGPQSFLNILLTASDTAVDRKRAEARAEEVTKAMKDVDWDKANAALPTFCVNLRQNMPEGDQRTIANQMDILRRDPMAKGFKVLNMGLLLMNHMGYSAVHAARNSLGDRITANEALERGREEQRGFIDRLLHGASQRPRTTVTREPEANANDWHNSDVVITLRAVSASEGSPVREIHYTVTNASRQTSSTVQGDQAVLAPISVEGETQLAYNSVDSEGNSEHRKSQTLSIDKTAPVIQIAVPADGDSYPQGSQVTADYGCSDGREGSGVESCTGTVERGGPLDTTSVGGKRFTVTAEDRAGNQSEVTHEYTVVAPEGINDDV